MLIPGLVFEIDPGNAFDCMVKLDFLVIVAPLNPLVLAERSEVFLPSLEDGAEPGCHLGSFPMKVADSERVPRRSRKPDRPRALVGRRDPDP
mmetsp:Transcript_17361/g.24289  ORF Transcript_17361/g.24289 Transcript_17361/m.24289 type:complete len:92 (+) Transcript_17361:489-764(+)